MKLKKSSLREQFIIYLIIYPSLSFGNTHEDDSKITKSLEPSPTCFGQPMPNFELPQFTEVKNQRDEGTCYSYSAVACVEAALYRKSGNKKSLSTEYTTVNHCLKPRQLDTPVNTRQKIIGSLNDFNKFFDGGKNIETIESLLANQRAPWDLPPKQEKEVQKLYKELKIKAGELSLESQSQEKALMRGKVEIKDQIDELTAEIEDLKEKFEEAKKNHKTTNAIRDELESKFTKKEELDIKWNEINFKIEKIYSQNSRVICEAAHCFLKKLDDNSNSVDLRELEITRDYINLDFDEKDRNQKNHCEPKDNIQNIKNVMRNLCIGVPVSVGLSNTSVIARENSDTEFKAKDITEGHAMVITGVKTLNNTPFFTFRNSWGKKGKETLLPFFEACKLTSTGGVVNRIPINGETISEAEAWIHSDMNKPSTEAEKKSYELFKSRLGKFIKKPNGEEFATEEKESPSTTPPPTIPPPASIKHKTLH